MFDPTKEKAEAMVKEPLPEPFDNTEFVRRKRRVKHCDKARASLTFLLSVFIAGLPLLEVELSTLKQVWRFQQLLDCDLFVAVCFLGL